MRLYARLGGTGGGIPALPCHDFANPELDMALGVFISIVGDTLGDSLRSVILYGSVAFGDLAPGYGDLDFVAITDNDIAHDRGEALIESPRILVTSVVSKRRHMLFKNCRNSLQLLVPIQTCVILYRGGWIGTSSIWARVCLLNSVSYCMVREVSQEDNNACS